MPTLTRAANRKKNPVQKLSYTIDEFCAAMEISRSFYEKLKRENKQPREIHIGKAIRISQRAATDWIAAHEK